MEVVGPSCSNALLACEISEETALMWVNSSVCWGDRLQGPSPDHAGNTDSTAKKPLVTLDVKDPDSEAGVQALADL